MKTIGFIPYEQALALKKLGFNEPCLVNYLSPLYLQVFRFFKDNYNLNGSANKLDDFIGMYNWEIIDKDLSCISEYPYRSFKEAELECIKKLILLAANRKKCQYYINKKGSI
jgi:hypothetical protein